MPGSAQIALITIFTDNTLAMVRFYRDVLGFRPLGEVNEADLAYTEFAHEGVRFAICARAVMRGTVGHPAYDVAPGGQVFSLAFPCTAPAEVDTAYAEAVSRGATPIHPPADMPWNQRTALFADPDGHIHEFFADLPPGG